MNTYSVKLDKRVLDGVKVRVSPAQASRGSIWTLHDKLAPECAAKGNLIKADRVKVVDVCAKQKMIVLISA